MFWFAPKSRAFLCRERVEGDDVKMENEGVRPEDKYYPSACIPDAKAELMFRKSKTDSISLILDDLHTRCQFNVSNLDSVFSPFWG